MRTVQTSINLVSDGLDDLVALGLVSADGIVATVTNGSTGQNLIDSVTKLTINNATSDDISSLQSLSDQTSTLDFSLVVNFADYTVSVSEFSDLVDLVSFANKVTYLIHKKI